MSHQAFRYEFSARELMYLLFRKKSCPECGGRMEKVKGYETKLGSDFHSSGRGMFFADNDRVKHYQYAYHCHQCGSQFTLQELAK